MAAPDQELKSVIVVIAGRPYPLRVGVREETSVRAMADKINDRINDFQVKFSDRDIQDCLVMTLLTYGDELRQTEGQGSGEADTEVADRLVALNAIVDGMMAE